MLKTIGLKTKILLGYSFLILFVAFTGAVGYQGVKNVARSLYQVGSEEAPLIKMANEMKLSLIKAGKAMEEYKGATATMATAQESAIQGIVDNYTQSLKDFDTFVGAVIEGATLEDGMVVIKTDNNNLADLIRKVDQLHSDKFQVSADQLFEKGKLMVSGKATLNVAMKNMEKFFSETYKNASTVESLISQKIEESSKEAQLGKAAIKILKEEVPLANVANKLKISLAESRIALEELAQMTDLSMVEELAGEYEEKIDTFDQQVKAILNGGKIDGTTIISTNNEDIRRSVAELNKNHEIFQKHSNELIQAVRSIIVTLKDSDVAMANLDSYGAEAEILLNSVEAAAGREMEKAKKEGSAAVDVSVSSIISTLIIAIIIGLTIGLLLTRSITKPINEIIKGLSAGAEQVSSASGQVSDSSQSLAEGSSIQASSLEETSSSLEEMSAMTKQNAANANQADSLMKETNAVVSEANSSMSELTKSIKEISNASEETQKIIKTIDEIAFQTNLLALNAAVEAARAGDAGAGFAVVAEEVRNLAMRSAEAAKDTASLIEETVKKVNDGSQLVDRTNQAFVKVAASSEKVGGLIGEISAASNEQSSGIEEVNKAVSEMDKVTQQNAASSEETASAAEEMNGQASQMMSFVGDLVSIVGGKGSGTPSRTSHSSDPVVVTGIVNSPKSTMKNVVTAGFTPPRHSKKLNGHSSARSLPTQPRSNMIEEVETDQVFPMSDEELKEF